MSHKPIIAYPVPMDSPEVYETFLPFVKRFCQTFMEYPGDCEIALLKCVKKTDEWYLEKLAEHYQWLYPAEQTHYIYDSNGCDIGSAQWLSKQLHPDRLMIMMTSRCYFHKAGWLERYLEAHDKDPDALLGASASWEGGKRHICTRAYAMRAGLFASYPHLIDTREKGQKFEVDEWCITDWFAENQRHTLQVTFDGVQEQPDWRNPDNIFRKGNQSNMIVHDKHSDLYRDAGPEEKLRLEKEVAPRM
jgi:hypothetical protein